MDSSAVGLRVDGHQHFRDLASGRGTAAEVYGLAPLTVPTEIE